MRVEAVKLECMKDDRPLNGLPEKVCAQKASMLAEECNKVASIAQTERPDQPTKTVGPVFKESGE